MFNTITTGYWWLSVISFIISVVVGRVFQNWIFVTQVRDIIIAKFTNFKPNFRSILKNNLIVACLIFITGILGFPLICIVINGIIVGVIMRNVGSLLILIALLHGVTESMGLIAFGGVGLKLYHCIINSEFLQINDIFADIIVSILLICVSAFIETNVSKKLAERLIKQTKSQIIDNLKEYTSPHIYPSPESRKKQYRRGPR